MVAIVALLLLSLTLPVFSRVRKRNILIDVHVCSAQPFLEEFIEEYGNCNDEIVYLRDGTLLSLEDFVAHVNTSNALTEGAEGLWKKERKFIRFHPNPGQEKTLERPELAYSLPIKSAEPFECLMIRITSKNELTSSSLSFRIASKQNLTANGFPVRFEE